MKVRQIVEKLFIDSRESFQATWNGVLDYGDNFIIPYVTNYGTVGNFKVTIEDVLNSKYAEKEIQW